MRHTPACDTQVLGGKLLVPMVITVISSSGNEANQVYPLVKTENSDFLSSLSLQESRLQVMEWQLHYLQAFNTTHSNKQGRRLGRM